MKRRSFLIGAGATGISALAIGAATKGHGAGVEPAAVRNTNPQKALILWYSQTGHTARLGKLLVARMKAKGLDVTKGRLDRADLSKAGEYDLVMIGSPVQYMEVPKNVRLILRELPPLNGTAVASWVTFGGRGTNPINAGWNLLELLAEKGGATVGMQTFCNMNTFSPAWTSDRGKARVLKYRDLPNEDTFEKCRSYGDEVLDRVKNGQTIEVGSDFDLSALLVYANSRWWTKKLIGEHYIDKEKCIQCGTCTDTCPARAVNHASYSIDRDACLACFGCLNNCPAGAMTMEFMGDELYGFVEFCKREGIRIAEPPELLQKA